MQWSDDFVSRFVDARIDNCILTPSDDRYAAFSYLFIVNGYPGWLESILLHHNHNTLLINIIEIDSLREPYPSLYSPDRSKNQGSELPETLETTFAWPILVYFTKPITQVWRAVTGLLRLSVYVNSWKGWNTTPTKTYIAQATHSSGWATDRNWR